MSKDTPILKSVREGKELHKIYAGLHYLRGNSSPYFAITCDTYERGVWVAGGCQHELIEHIAPEFSDIIALHLSDIDGAPSHAIENGLYFAAGCYSGFHRGLGSKYFWDSADYYRTPAIEVFARHIRVPVPEAQELITEVGKRYNFPDIKAHLRNAMDAMRPRWKREAESCIARHKLQLCGDAWSTRWPRRELPPLAEKYGLKYRKRTYACEECGRTELIGNNHTGVFQKDCPACRNYTRYVFAENTL